MPDRPSASPGLEPQPLRVLLTTRRLVLRSFASDDLDALVSLLADPAVSWFPYRSARPAAAAEAILDAQLAAWRTGVPARWVVMHDGTFLGYAGFRPSPWPGTAGSVDIGWRLARAAWGRGFAAEAGEAMIDEVFRARAARAVFATYEPGNERTARLVQRLGFEHAFKSVEYGRDVMVVRLDEQLWRTQRAE